MKKTLKCALFLTLIVLALFAMTMFGASAATHANDTDAISAGDVVKVAYTKNGVATTEYYATVSAAVTGMGDAIADGATITVLDDISADAATTISAGTVTINGNGHTVDGFRLTVSGATVSVNNLKVNVSVTRAITLSGGTLTFGAGTELTTTVGDSIYVTGGTLNIDGEAAAPVKMNSTKNTVIRVYSQNCCRPATY